MNERSKTKKSLVSCVVSFLKNRPVLVFFVLAGCFLLAPNVSRADLAPNVSRADGAVLDAFINWAVKPTIYLFFWLFSWFVMVAAKLFLWVIDAGTFTKLMNDGAIYEVWLVVRDFCNIFFILVLLFSAFATIFQLDKYEYKKTIPTLVIMALLVNFSFPISRFVIDLANVPMYFFAQNVFGSSLSNIENSLLSASSVREILIPNSTSPDVSVTGLNVSVIHLLSATICMFLFGTSFLVLAVLMLIRMIALAILVMYSPIGFVGMITPALQKFAREWWDKILKWSFFGPIAVMFVLVSIVFMNAAAKIHPVSSTQNLSGNSVDESYIASIAFFTIPIVLFWIAITSAEKYSSEMSGMSVNFGSRMGRWMGRQTRKGVMWPGQYAWRQSGVPGGVKTWWNERTGFLSSKRSQQRQERMEARVGGTLLGGKEGRKGALDAVERKRVYEQVDAYKKANKPYEDLKKSVEDGLKPGAKPSDKINAKAAAITMSEKEMFESPKDFSNALEAVAGDMDSVTKIIRKAPKEMLRSGDDLVKALEAVNTATAGLRPAAQAQIKSQLIDKAGSGALPTADAAGGGQYEKMIKALNGDSTLEKALEGKMKKEGRLKAVLEYRLKDAGTDATKRQLAYETTFEKLDAETLGKQRGLMNTDGFKKYFEQKTRAGRYNKQFLEDYFRASGGDGDREEFRKIMEKAKPAPEFGDGGGI